MESLRHNITKDFATLEEERTDINKIIDLDKYSKVKNR